ncbi:MAG: arylesterase [Gemmatimonadales bacterium]
MKAKLVVAAVTLTSAFAGCRVDGASSARTPAVDRGQAAPDARPTIVFLGTSLTAGLGLDPADAYPTLIQRRLDSLSIPLRVVNAGVSGETSAGALRRIDWVLNGPVALLVVETGANDGLRGQDPDSTAANIEAIIARARVHHPAPVVALMQMRSLPNYGTNYRRRFDGLYPALARKEGVVLVPFLLDGVAGIDTLNQNDGVHPNVKGERIVADNVWRGLEPVIHQIVEPRKSDRPRGA